MNLFHTGFLVDAEFTAGLPFEVLDRIRNINLSAVDIGLIQTFIQQFPSRTYKGSPLFIFLVARLLADHHDGDFGLRGFGSRLQLSEDGLRRIPIEVTTVTLLHGIPENR
jgi:hypothetical protein